MKYPFRAMMAAALLAAMLTGCGDEYKPANPTDQFVYRVLQMIAANQADRLYNQYGSPDLQQQFPRRQWREDVQKMSALGEPVSMERKSQSVQTFTNEAGQSITVGDYTYDVKWADAEGTFDIQMRRIGGRWRVGSVRCNAEASD